MPHQRTVIRKAVVAAIKAANTLAEQRVFSTRKNLYGMRELPAISVYALNEKSSLDRTAPRELERIVSVDIEALVEKREDIDDEMDDIALEIETAMNLDPNFASEVKWSELTSTTLVSDPDGDRELGHVTLTYDMTYDSDAFVEPALVDQDDLNTVHTDYDLGGTQAPADQESDTITVQAP